MTHPPERRLHLEMTSPLQVRSLYLQYHRLGSPPVRQISTIVDAVQLLSVSYN